VGWDVADIDCVLLSVFRIFRGDPEDQALLGKGIAC
jgi:hypothetical protein